MQEGVRGTREATLVLVDGFGFRRLKGHEVLHQFSLGGDGSGDAVLRKDSARLVEVLVDGAGEKGVGRFVGFGCEALEGAVRGGEGRRRRDVSGGTVEPEERTSQIKDQFGWNKGSAVGEGG